eukprot:scaffold198628_cov21-Tisochrysis_lutea.AAC.1
MAYPASHALSTSACSAAARRMPAPVHSTTRSSNAPAAERWRTHALSKPLRPSAQLCTFAARGNRFEAACSIRPLQRSQLASWAQAPGWGEQGHLGQGGRGGLRMNLHAAVSASKAAWGTQVPAGMSWAFNGWFSVKLPHTKAVARGWYSCAGCHASTSLLLICLYDDLSVK